MSSFASSLLALPFPRSLAIALAAACAAGGCASTDLPRDPPPLASMQEPLELMEEPDDEAARAALAKGSFTGIVVGDARASLDEMLAAPAGVLVKEVVENSPAALAGVEVGDLIVEVRGAQARAVSWPSEWRELELATEPGATLQVVVDRAGAEVELPITTVARVAPPARSATQRFREEARVGVVLRTATEVEARGAHLGPGGGAVVVGLSAESPWRTRGIVYGDLVRAVDGEEVADPSLLLDRIRNSPEDAELELAIVRAGSEITIRAPVSDRAREMKRVSIPLIYSFSRDRDLTTTSILLGLIRWEHTPAAWNVRLLWFIDFGGGDANRLEPVEQ